MSLLAPPMIGKTKNITGWTAGPLGEGVAPRVVVVELGDVVPRAVEVPESEGPLRIDGDDDDDLEALGGTDDADVPEVKVGADVPGRLGRAGLVGRGPTGSRQEREAKGRYQIVGVFAWSNGDTIAKRCKESKEKDALIHVCK
ncbi:LOW QUALITY PROTEIN: hypothetical protein ColTof4_02611 [Colletotrichum tofieldiae]|nr:LOW QUALITY PROTEIN: hypothetical protein ColTof4_02611 [Colletotrichum tofieldiae]GKT93236.1 LOW QUALITY PROTEIN: hypothetical protein Ct61P_11086 [Colletotrichum tofieldiae]